MAINKTDIAAEVKSDIRLFGHQSFPPGAYKLDLSLVKDMAMDINGQPSTFGDIYRELRDSKIEYVPDIGESYVTDKGDVNVDGKWPLVSTMQILINLSLKGMDPYQVMWFYYGHDRSGDAAESYEFFAVYREKIVEDCAFFSSEHPAVLKLSQDDDPIWYSGPYFVQAQAIYWYRKFYTETMMGNLMVLRPDEPVLYYFLRPSEADTLERNRRAAESRAHDFLLLLSVLLLSAIAFPSIDTYIAFAAIAIAPFAVYALWTGNNSN